MKKNVWKLRPGDLITWEDPDSIYKDYVEHVKWNWLYSTEMHEKVPIGGIALLLEISGEVDYTWGSRVTYSWVSKEGVFRAKLSDNISGRSMSPRIVVLRRFRKFNATR